MLFSYKMMRETQLDPTKADQARSTLVDAEM